MLSVKGGVRDVLGKQVMLNYTAYISTFEDTRDARLPVQPCRYLFPVAL